MIIAGMAVTLPSQSNIIAINLFYLTCLFCVLCVPCLSCIFCGFCIVYLFFAGLKQTTSSQDKRNRQKEYDFASK